LPSASWVRDARSASTPPARLRARAGLVFVSVLMATGVVSQSHLAGAQQSPSGSIVLKSQDAWVRSSHVPIRLGLSVSSPIAPADLLVSVALYTEPDGSSLASRDEFDATLEGDLAGLSQLTTTFSLSSVSDKHGFVTLYLGGSGLPGRIPARAPGDEVFRLPCPERYGGCDGVYPLQVSLVDVLTGQPVDSFTTYLIVAPSTVAPQRRLHFSFILPVGASAALRAAGTPAVPSTTVAQIDTIVREERSWPSASLTLELYGQTLLALDRSREHASLVKTIGATGIDTLVAGPFSAVDPTQLVRTGLADDLASQLELGDDVFSTVLRTSVTSHLYVATAPVGTRGLAALAADGINEIVVPQVNLASLAGGRPSAVQWPYTLSAPFRIAGSPVEGLQADPGLAAHLNGAANPALRAQQLLADLAEIYFDSPDYPKARGVVLVAPRSWAPEAEFLSATLSGLNSSPIITTMPVGRLFATVPLGTCQEPPSIATGCSAASRSIVSPTLSGYGSITSAQVQAARTQLAELSSIIPSETGTIRNLDEAILLAETAGLDPDIRESYLSAPMSMTLSLGSELSLPTGKTVTVTSSSARFPIAITSGSRTPLHAILVVSGTDLTSPSDAAVVLRHGTNTFIVRVNTRTSGDSSLQLQLDSPFGHFELARVSLTIRSTAVSGVAIALTVGAGAFLLFWWLRSAARRRRRRGGKHLSHAQHKQAPATAQGPGS